MSHSTGFWFLTIGFRMEEHLPSYERPMNYPASAQSNRLPQSHIEALKTIENGYWWFEGRVFWATQMAGLGNISHTDYMDIGCGTGGFAKSFLKNVPASRAALIDGDEALLKIASLVPNVEIHRLDLSTDFMLPWSPSLVTCMDVIEHLPDDSHFLTRLGKQMKPKGEVILSVPALPWLFSDWDRHLGHFRRYTAKSLLKTVTESGFEMVRLSYFWSFLTPIGIFRKFRKTKAENAMEFEPVMAPTNALLKQFSKMEWQMSKVISPPFGTSLMVLARKI